MNKFFQISFYAILTTILAVLFTFLMNYMFEQSIINIFLIWLISFFVSIIFINTTIISLKNKKLTIDDLDIKILKFIYLAILIIALFGRNGGQFSIFGHRYAYNIIPFYDISLSFIDLHSILILIANLIIFIPFGINKKCNVIYYLLLFVFIELVQMLFNVGSFDINDIIFYIVGFLFGWSFNKTKIYKKIKILCNKHIIIFHKDGENNEDI